MSIWYLDIKNMDSISNHQIIHFFSKEEYKDLQKKIAAAFPSNFINCLISFYSIMKKSKKFSHPFLIMNTERFDKKAGIGGFFSISIQEKK